MGFPTLLNCLFLTYGPLVVVYTAKKDHLSANMGFFFKGLVSGIIALIFKLFITGFFTSSEFYIYADSGIIEFCIMYIAALRYKEMLDDKYRIISFMLGVSAIYGFLNYFMYFLSNALGTEFSWGVIMKAFEANYDTGRLVCIIMLSILATQSNSGIVYGSVFVLSIIAMNKLMNDRISAIPKLAIITVVACVMGNIGSSRFKQ